MGYIRNRKALFFKKWHSDPKLKLESYIDPSLFANMSIDEIIKDVGDYLKTDEFKRYSMAETSEVWQKSSNRSKVFYSSRGDRTFGTSGNGRTFGTSGMVYGTSGSGNGTSGIGYGTSGGGYGTSGMGYGTSGSGYGTSGIGYGTSGSGMPLPEPLPSDLYEILFNARMKGDKEISNQFIKDKDALFEAMDNGEAITDKMITNVYLDPDEFRTNLSNLTSHDAKIKAQAEKYIDTLGGQDTTEAVLKRLRGNSVFGQMMKKAVGWPGKANWDSMTFVGKGISVLEIGARTLGFGVAFAMSGPIGLAVAGGVAVTSAAITTGMDYAAANHIEKHGGKNIYSTSDVFGMLGRHYKKGMANRTKYDRSKGLGNIGIFFKRQGQAIANVIKCTPILNKIIPVKGTIPEFSRNGGTPPATWKDLTPTLDKNALSEHDQIASVEAIQQKINRGVTLVVGMGAKIGADALKDYINKVNAPVIDTKPQPAVPDHTPVAQPTPPVATVPPVTQATPPVAAAPVAVTPLPVVPDVAPATPNFADACQYVHDIMMGKYGNNPVRKELLGIKYEQLQKMVNLAVGDNKIVDNSDFAKENIERAVRAVLGQK